MPITACFCVVLASLSALSGVREKADGAFKGSEGASRREWIEMRLEAAERLESLPDRTKLMQAELDEFRDGFNAAFDMWRRDPCNPEISAEEFDAAAFGAVGDGITDDTPAFVRAAAAVRVRCGRPCRLKIPAGTYLLESTTRTASGIAAHLDLSSLTNCSVSGSAPGSVRFEFGEHDKAGVVMDRSENVTLANVEFSWRETPFSQVSVENFDPQSGTALVRHRPGTLRPDDPRYKRAAHPAVCGVFDPSGRKLLDRGPDPFFTFKAEDLGDGRFRLFFDAKRPSLAKFRPRAGDVIAIPDRNNAIAGLRLRGSSFCNLVNVWFRNAPSVAISGVAARYLAAYGCRVFPKEEGLVLSSNADALFNERGTHISRCDFGNMNDDGANSHCKGVDILSRRGDRTIVVRPSPGRIRKGDVVQIVQAMEGKMLGDFRIAALRHFTAENGGARLELTFEEALPPQLSTCADAGEHDAATRYALSHGGGRVEKAADILFAPLAFGAGFTMRGNRIHDLRGCGVNVQCSHAIIEGNEISSVGQGLKITGLTEWREGPPPCNVVVRNNLFCECRGGIASKFSTINRSPSKERPIRWIEISSNRFEHVTLPADLHNESDVTNHDNASFSGADGMVPLLAITGRPTEAEARARVSALHAQGMQSFLIYARSGLQLEYMGEDWLKLCEWLCDEAERRGMKVWLYDEYNWPSGTCRGRVPSENDAWRYAECGVFRKADGSFRWTSALAPAGWVNVCEPDAVKRFIELTHEVYARWLGRWFKNKTILGVFTDEPGHPNKVTFSDGKPIVSFRTYSGLEDDYRAATGRDLKGDVERWIDTREGNVWETYLDLMGRRFRSAYFDPLRSWCDAHGLLLTGHLMAENDIYVSAKCNGNPVLCLRGESLPGMDDVRTLCDADPKARPIEWVTYNLARQAALHRGNGGMAELFACGPADHVPATLRTVIWMCAMHGIDRYFTCMEVMDERGLVEKHGFLAPTGSRHPWYERHARILADEARTAAMWARKTVAEREVAVRYPNRLAARFAISGKPKGVQGPDVAGLLRTLELNQFTCRLLDEDEATSLPLVFSCRADGRFSELRTGKDGLSLEDVLAICRERLPTSFSVSERDGLPAEDVLVRKFTDGTCAVLNMRAFSARSLMANRGGARVGFDMPPRGIALFDAAGRMLNEMPVPTRRIESLQDVEWNLCLDAPNIKRINFDEAKKGTLTAAKPLKDVHLATRECAMSYAVTPSGRPVGVHEQPADGVKILRHVAEPYAFAMDGAPVVPAEPCACLRPGYNPLYRQTKPFDLKAGGHDFSIVSGEADRNYFLPALFLVGDFTSSGGILSPRSGGKVKFGTLASLGLGDFTGTATWSAEVLAPHVPNARLRIDTGGRVARVAFAGVELGERAWAPFEWELPAAFAGKRGLLEISVSTSVLPMFGDVSAGKWDSRFWNGVSGPDGPCGLLLAEWVHPSGTPKRSVRTIDAYVPISEDKTFPGPKPMPKFEEVIAASSAGGAVRRMGRMKATAVEALDFDVDTGDALHLVRGSLRAPDLLFRNLSKEARHWKGTVRFKDYFGRGFEKSVDVKAGPEACMRVAVERDMSCKGIWYVTAKLTGDDGLSGRVESRFAVIDDHKATPALPKPFFRMGINFHAQHYWNTPHFEHLLEALVASGAKLVRSGGFKFAETARKSTYDWTMADALVKAYRSKGLSINANVYPGPPWARIEPSPEQMKMRIGQRMNLPPREGLFRDYCAALAARYGTDIDYYEMGNEWDLVPQEILPPDEAMRILREGYGGIKSSCPAATVVTCGWAGADPAAHCDKWNSGLMARYATTAQDAFDVWAIHLHGTFESYAERIQKKFLPFREKSGLIAKPWYSNETAMPTGKGREGEAARAVWQKILYAWAWGSADYVWYNLRATGWNPDAHEDSYGLMTPDYRPRATFAAFSALTSLLEGGRFERRLVDSGRRHIYRFRSPRNGGITIAGWDADLREGETITIRSDAKAAWSIDLMGNRSRLGADAGTWSWTVSREPSAIVLEGATAASICETGDGP